jgi:23S rRNA (uracil-5-)-methyltransferase RumA
MTQTLTPKLLRRQIIDLLRDAERAEPRCPHAPPAGMCGGCTFQERSYAAQLDAKRTALSGLWAGDLPSELLSGIQIVGSPSAFGYRTRMDYVCSKDRFGLRRGGKFNFIIDLDQCHLLPDAAFAAARQVYDHAVGLGLPDFNLRSHEGFLRYIVVRRSPDDQILLALVTSAPDAEGRYASAIAEIAAEALQDPQVVGLHWLVNDTKTDISFGAYRQHWGAESLAMRVGSRALQIGPNTFFQNNVYLLEPLLDDVAGLVGQADGIADLYGGVGTIALRLAEQSGQIVCVESVAESVAWARRNMADNLLPHISIVQAETLAFLREQPVGAFPVIVADPPRTGLGPDVCRELLRLRPERIVYVSCNPITQVEDARALASGYRPTQLRGYDMFPQTPHLESLALFEAI